MRFVQRSRKILVSLILVLVLITSTACSTVQTDRPTSSVPSYSGTEYSQISRGNTAYGQDFGQWVVQTASGIVSDAYVRDDNKLGVVITPQVRPDEVRPLTRSLVEGFRKNFPNRDLKVLVYAPDKQLILTADYDNQSQQIRYE
jgi:hypothetical protein